MQTYMKKVNYYEFCYIWCCHLIKLINCSYLLNVICCSELPVMLAEGHWTFKHVAVRQEPRVNTTLHCTEQTAGVGFYHILGRLLYVKESHHCHVAYVSTTNITWAWLNHRTSPMYIGKWPHHKIGWYNIHASTHLLGNHGYMAVIYHLLWSQQH
jgi:hypothetical protein